jgi:hypothetical protein
MSLLLYNSGYEQLAKAAGCVSLYDARKDWAIANGVTPDRSGKGNDITWANFAGNSASGLIYEDGKWFRRCDGGDDFGSMVNTASIDITSAPLAEFATIKLSDIATTGFIFCKNLDNTINAQYSMLWDATNKYIRVDLENANRCNSGANSVLPDIWHDVGYIWDGTTIKIYINLVASGIAGSYSGLLTSRPHATIGRRSNSIDNSTGIGYFKGALANHVIYSGANAVESKILKSRAAISKAYI